MDYVVSIDCSINSPAVCVYDMENDFYHLYSYTDKIPKNSVIKFTKENCSIFIERKIKEEDYTDDFTNTTNKILKFIGRHTTKEFVIVLEGYSYGSKGRSIFDIAELGGILKYRLKETFKNAHLFIVTPSEWKKEVVKHGNADKEKIANYLIENDNTWSSVLDHFLELALDEKFGKKRDPSKLKDKIYESPVNDVTDAYCICQYFLNKRAQTVSD